jgi:hypothetical protein
MHPYGDVSHCRYQVPLSSPSLDMETLLLAVYFLVVLYVLYQMALSLEDKLEDKVDIFIEENTLGEQTQAQLEQQRDNPLARRITARVRNMNFSKDKKVKRPVLSLIFDADKEQVISPEMRLSQKELGMSEKVMQELMLPKIILRIAPTNEQVLKKIMFLSVSVINDTSDVQVYINWDRSSLEMFGQGNRVVRATPNVPVDLSQSQVSTVINPGMTVSCNITTEQKYFRNTETSLVRETPQPLVDLKEKIEMSRLTDPKSGEENVQKLYSLDLMVGMKYRTKSDYEMISLLVPFIFKMKIKIDQPAFPPARWLLRHFGKRRPPSQGNWFWGSSRLEGSRLEDRK